MSKSLRIIFLVPAIVSAILGVLFLVTPGRFLGLFGWAPVDPILCRPLGEAFPTLRSRDARLRRARLGADAPLEG